MNRAYGQWYATGYNIETKKAQVFRCDKIQSVRSSEKHHSKPMSDFLASREMYKEKDAIDFKIGISHKSVDLFNKEHYPSMELFHEVGQYYIRGFFNKGEETFIANYFLQYGNMISSIQPI